MEADIEALAESHGGYWSEHIDYPVQDWAMLALNNETRRGYWEWVEAQLEHAKDNEEGNEIEHEKTWRVERREDGRIDVLWHRGGIWTDDQLGPWGREDVNSAADQYSGDVVSAIIDALEEDN